VRLLLQLREQRGQAVKRSTENQELLQAWAKYSFHAYVKFLYFTLSCDGSRKLAGHFSVTHISFFRRLVRRIAKMKIENRLSPADFSVLADAFRDGDADFIELLPSIDFGFVRVLPLVVSRSDNGHVLSTRMFFADPIGNTVCVKTGTEELGIWKSSKKIELDLKKPLSNSEELGKDIAYGLLLVEKVVNYACMIHDENNYDSIVVDSKSINKQIENRKKENQDTKNSNPLKSFIPK
jgi:hypothetical protein